MSDVFNKILEAEAEDPEFARDFAAEAARIETIDAIINALNDTREDRAMSKAELARAVGIDPSTMRRLLSSQSSNPTLGTVATIAAALGFRVVLEPLPAHDCKRLTNPMQACASL